MHGSISPGPGARRSAVQLWCNIASEHCLRVLLVKAQKHNQAKGDICLKRVSRPISDSLQHHAFLHAGVSVRDSCRQRSACVYRHRDGMGLPHHIAMENAAPCTSF